MRTCRTWPSPRNERLGSPIVSLSRLQDSHVATARTLAPSTEAFDAPLSAMVLTIKPGPATGLSGDYPDETHARWSGPALRTHHFARVPPMGYTGDVSLK
jgi:hypothetical protein